MSTAGGGAPQTLLLLEAGDAFTGHPAPSPTAPSHPPHAGAGSDGAALKALGRTGVSPKLENRGILRVLVTTGRLQRLARGIFSEESWSGASTSVGGHGRRTKE